MEYRRYQPPCARFIVTDDPHSKCVKCLGFSHAREAVYGKSPSQNPPLSAWGVQKGVIRFSPVAPRRPLRPLVSPRPGVRMLSSRRWKVSRQASPFLSLPLPSTCAQIQHFYPSPGALDTVSFVLDDILLTAASDSEDFGPALADALPPCGQEARPSAAYSELVDVLSRATEKLSLDWPDEPRESQASKLDERFLGGPNSRPERRKLPFFSDLHQEISRSW